VCQHCGIIHRSRPYVAGGCVVVIAKERNEARAQLANIERLRKGHTAALVQMARDRDEWRLQLREALAERDEAREETAQVRVTMHDVHEYATSMEEERDEAREEVGRMRPVVDAAMRATDPNATWADEWLMTLIDRPVGRTTLSALARATDNYREATNER